MSHPIPQEVEDALAKIFPRKDDDFLTLHVLREYQREKEVARQALLSVYNSGREAEVEMPSYKRGSGLTTGEKYYFVDTDFRHVTVPLPVIKQRTIYQIVGDDFTTKENGDRYAVERYFAFTTEEDAKQYALRSLLEYKKSVIKEIDNKISALSAPSSEDKV